MRAVLLDHEAGGALSFRYDPVANALLKDCGWRWKQESRIWIAPPYAVEDGVVALRELGYLVDDQRKQRAPSGPSVVDRISYYEQYFTRIPAADRTAAHRRLMLAFHPDHYGDEEEAKAINAAWDRVRGRNQR